MVNPAIDIKLMHAINVYSQYEFVTLYLRDPRCYQAALLRKVENLCTYARSRLLRLQNPISTWVVSTYLAKIRTKGLHMT